MPRKPAQRKPATTSPRRLHGLLPSPPLPALLAFWRDIPTTPPSLPTELDKLSWLNLLDRNRIPATEQPAYFEWWHSALAARDSARIDALSSAVAVNNGNVAALANGLDLAVSVLPITSPDSTIPDRILQYNAADMARRIEAAAAKHKNRARNGRSDNQNRNLKYVCPTCSRPIRSAGQTRVIMCGGTYEVPHEPALCSPEEMPLNRAQDLLAASGDIELPIPATGDQSTAQTRAHVKRQREIVNAAGVVQNNPAPRFDDIPF